MGKPQEGKGTGREHGEEPGPEHMCSAVVRGCREEGTTRQEAKRERGKEKKPAKSAAGERTAQMEKAAGEQD